MGYLYKSLIGRTVNIGSYVIRATGTSFEEAVPELEAEVGVSITLENLEAKTKLLQKK